MNSVSSQTKRFFCSHQAQHGITGCPQPVGKVWIQQSVREAIPGVCCGRSQWCLTQSAIPQRRKLSMGDALFPKNTYQLTTGLSLDYHWIRGIIYLSLNRPITVSDQHRIDRSNIKPQAQTSPVWDFFWSTWAKMRWPLPRKGLLYPQHWTFACYMFCT